MDPKTERVIDAMLAILETGKLPTGAAYATTVVLRDQAGITYGKHQTTDHSGGLDAVCLRYMELGGSFAAKIRPHLSRLAGNETVSAASALTSNAQVVEEDGNVILRPMSAMGALPDWMVALLFALYEAAKHDPLMRQAQDEVFQERYWAPAFAKGRQMGLELPLSYAVIYDTYIQSGSGVFAKVRSMFQESPPSSYPAATPAEKVDIEKAWTTAYVDAREQWLASFTHPDAAKQQLVRTTVYRPKAFRTVIASGDWGLAVPLTFRGIQITG